ncbi:ParB N-terminal domain-containing protein [Pseudoruegeria sp. HB172150]|uniref:ParB/RepB/Spo0J family partition protein n=1 Tax=Pseudoruegeria sp. HB172150 TaxID=2721164 RepID=UPI001552874F|nr:ParB N-terminal domain-containing protein [Pseudoruegeria sp. HB172150]
MAKRKRLSPAQSDYLESETPALETKSMPIGRAPIAQVAGEAATSAALQELAGELKQARDEGRLILTLDEAAIEAGYLVRDRILADDEELQALMESLRARGQQTPVEVVELEGGRFGLISGWRRLTALRRLRAETGEDRFGQVKALLRRPESASDAYVAMVEENEIRVGLSYYERARVAARAVEQGVYTDEKAALLSLFASASRAKRSKIRSFLTIYHAADDALRFPMAIGERLGLALSKALDEAPERIDGLLKTLADRRPESAEAELELLGKWVAAGRARPDAAQPAGGPKPKTGNAVPQGRAMPQGFGEVAPGIGAKWNGRSLTLSGPGVSETLRRDLFDWIRNR